MTCGETQHLLNGYIDGEMDWGESRAIENHVQDCASCSKALAELQSLASALEDETFRFKAPRRLRSAVLADIQRTTPVVSRSSAFWRLTVYAASVILIVGLVSIVATRRVRPTGQTELVADIVSSHVRSLMADHLTDVSSSDTHNVKPWFADKLDYSPPTKDLTAQGFRLIGGRMDYVDNRPVAAVVYQRNRHFINLFVWPATAGPAESETQSAVRGYNLVHWTKAGMTYWLVSDLNSAELKECAGLLKE